MRRGAIFQLTMLGAFRGRKMYGGVSTVLPLSLNPAGVIPIIFAMSVMLIPGMFASVFTNVKIAWLATCLPQSLIFLTILCIIV